jgi:phage-related protein
MLPTNEDFNSLNLNKVVHTLLEIQSTTPIYLVDDNQNFTFNNKTFIAFPWKLEGITESSKGEEPKIKISVSNITNLVMQILEEGIDNTPVIIRVVREGETEADLEFRYVANSYSYDQNNIIFDLTAPVNYLKSFPTGNYSSVCPFVFKGWQCRYLGNKTACNKTAKQCKEYGNLARFGGFQSEIS